MTWFAVRAVVVGLLVAVWANNGAAAEIRPGELSDSPAMVYRPKLDAPIRWRPIFPRPGDYFSQMVPNPLKGTQYKISGLNSRLPSPGYAEVVKFDGVPESVGGYLVNESWRRIVNENGKSESWIDFEFTPNPLYCPVYGPHASELAEDMQRMWRVSMSDFELAANTSVPEFYMYFTDNGVPAPFQPRIKSGTAFPIDAHPFLSGVSVLSSSTKPLSPNQLPPGATNGLVTEFQHYFSAVHDVARGMGVPRGVNGFHIGYRIVPEPATCVLGLFAAVASLLVLQRRRPREVGQTSL
jgi:hypothetical protein